MCGIVGYITTNDNLAYQERDFFLKQALIIDTLRGDDSTGVISVRNKFTINVTKSILAGHQFVECETFNRKTPNGWAAIGHNRAATRGSVKLENAHPFEFGPVALVHNGTLADGGRSLPSFQKDLEVDSMQIAYALSKVGPGPEAVRAVLEKVHGSFALVWTDSRDNSINMAKNRDRPLHFVVNDARTFLGFMSDGHMLNVVNRAMLRMGRFGGKSIYSMDNHKIFKFKKGSLVPEVTPFVPFLPKTSRQGQQQNSSKNTTSSKNTGSSSGTGQQSQGQGRKYRPQTQSSGQTPLLPRREKDTSTVKINGKRQDIPKGQRRALSMFFNLTPEFRLPFVYTEHVKVDKHTNIVVGTIAHPHWGDIAWDCVIMDVPSVEVSAYCNRTWTVQPIGLAETGIGRGEAGPEIPENPAMLAQVVSFDYNQYRELPNSPEIEESDEPGDLELIHGLDGKMIPVARLKAHLENGCVNCGGNLEIEHRKRYVYANNTTDVLCEDCKWNYV